MTRRTERQTAINYRITYTAEFPDGAEIDLFEVSFPVHGQSELVMHVPDPELFHELSTGLKNVADYVQKQPKEAGH